MGPRAWTAGTSAALAAGAVASTGVPVSMASTLVNLTPEYWVNSHIVIKAKTTIKIRLDVKTLDAPELISLNNSDNIANIYYGLINYFIAMLPLDESWLSINLGGR
jgi:hypothetical protein